MRRLVVWSFLLAYLELLLPSCAGNVKVVSNEIEAQKPIQLTEGTFDSELRRVPASYGVMLEFYAHWYVLDALSCSLVVLLPAPGPHIRSIALLRCPTCQAFQPAYEAVAAYFHTEPKVQPEVWVARVDCATEVRAGAANEYYISTLPLLFMLPQHICHTDWEQHV